MKKKVVTLSLVVALIATAAIGGTLAYFTDSEAKTNTFEVGEVDIVLTETAWADKENVVPGDTYEKNPVVNNVGENAAWVRVDVTITDAAAFTAAATKHGITDLSTIFKGHDESKWALAGTELKDDKLTYQYYYKEAVAVDGTTGALFTQVEIPAVFDNKDMESLSDEFKIEVVAHAIQVSEDYTTPADAFAKYKAQEPVNDAQ